MFFWKILILKRFWWKDRRRACERLLSCGRWVGGGTARLDLHHFLCIYLCSYLEAAYLPLRFFFDGVQLDLICSVVLSLCCLFFLLLPHLGQIFTQPCVVSFVSWIFSLRNKHCNPKNSHGRVDPHPQIFGFHYEDNSMFFWRKFSDIIYHFKTSKIRRAKVQAMWHLTICRMISWL